MLSHVALLAAYDHEAEEVIQDVFVQIWDKAATFDPVMGAPFSWALGINNADQVVGMCQNDNGGSNGFIYTDKMYDLNDLIPYGEWSVETANGGGASADQRSASIWAALPTRYGVPNCEAPSASSIGPSRGRINGAPLPLTT